MSKPEETISGEQIDRVYDNGFENGLITGAQAEQERIIKLLVNAEREANTAKPITGGSYGYWSGLTKAIELIKGENSE